MYVCVCVLSHRLSKLGQIRFSFQEPFFMEYVTFLTRKMHSDYFQQMFINEKKMYVDRHDDIDKNKMCLFIGSIFDYLWLMKLFIESF